MLLARCPAAAKRASVAAEDARSWREIGAVLKLTRALSQKKHGAALRSNSPFAIAFLSVFTRADTSLLTWIRHAVVEANTQVTRLRVAGGARTRASWEALYARNRRND